MAVKNSRFHTQTKGIINVVVTGVIGVACAFVDNSTTAWVILSVGVLIQGVLLFIPTIEEQHFLRKVEHLETMDGLNRVADEKIRKAKNAKKIEKMQAKAKKVSESNKPKENQLENFEKYKNIFETKRISFKFKRR
ncbi:MAG: hypothetical protein ACP5N1_03450 [Candidatus Woesearchaeota archaeon]